MQLAGASRRAQETGDALLKTILIALQDMHPAVSRLEVCTLERSYSVGVVLNHGRDKHFQGCNDHRLGNCLRISENIHCPLPFSCRIIGMSWGSRSLRTFTARAAFESVLCLAGTLPGWLERSKLRDVYCQLCLCVQLLIIGAHQGDSDDVFARRKAAKHD